MKIGIIGVGNMGSALGKLFAQRGHEIMFGFSRDTRKIEQAVRSSGSNAKSGTPEQAARFGCADADARKDAVLSRWPCLPMIVSSQMLPRSKVPNSLQETGVAVGWNRLAHSIPQSSSRAL